MIFILNLSRNGKQERERNVYNRIRKILHSSFSSFRFDRFAFSFLLNRKKLLKLVWGLGGLFFVIIKIITKQTITDVQKMRCLYPYNLQYSYISEFHITIQSITAFFLLLVCTTRAFVVAIFFYSK